MNANSLRSLVVGFGLFFLTFAMLAALSIKPAYSADFDADNPATFSVLPASCNYGAPEACVIQNYGASKPTVVVWGDSHMAQQIPAIRNHTANRQHNLTAFVLGLCPPYIPEASATDPCAQMSRKATSYINDLWLAGKRVTVVTGGHWQFYFTTTEGPRASRAAAFRNGEVKMWNFLASRNVRLVGTSQAPVIPLEGEPNAATCSLESITCPRSVMLRDETAISTWLADRVGRTNRNIVANVSNPYLCTVTECRIKADTLNLYYDELHLNVDETVRNQASYRWVVE